MDENNVLLNDSSGKKNEISQELNSPATNHHSDNIVDDKEKDINMTTSMISNDDNFNDDKATPSETNGNANEIIVDNSNHQEVKILDDNYSKITSLVEDSKLVKFSLPANSINIIQSNTQFLNKSRHFLNFITEKSTNIMEKALLPQHIASRYNGNDKKPIQDLSTSSTFGSSNNISYLTTNNENLTLNLSQKSDSLSNINNLGDEIDESIKKTSSTNGINTIDSPSFEKKYILTNDIPEILKNSNSITSNGHFNDIKTDDNITDLLKHSENYSDTEVSVENYNKIKIHNSQLIERLKQLEERNKQLELEINPVEIENRERTVERLTNELRMALGNNEDMRRDYIAANKERESMVMKYAVGEKQLIDSQRSRDAAEKKVKDLSRENENLQLKIKQLQGERTRICNILDTKCRELVDVQKDIEKYKDDVNTKDVKLKWLQSKLKAEMDIQKDTQQRLDSALLKINDMKNECEIVKKESVNSIRKFQQSEENKAVTLDEQLKEQQARLILERHVTEDKENLRIQLEKEVESLKNRQQVLIEENNNLSLRIQDLEKDHLNFESNYSNLKIIADKRQKEIVDLMTKVSQIETLKLQLIHKDQCLASNEAEVERLRLSNQEMQNDMECCRQREAHMLEFTQKLTDKNVRLQSEFSAIEAKSNQLDLEQGPLRQSIIELKEKVKLLEDNFNFEKKKRIEECEILAQHLAEQTKLAETLNRKFEDSQGENTVLKRKYQMSMKELSRELQQCRKKLELFEADEKNKQADEATKSSLNSLAGSSDTITASSSENSTSGESPISYNDLDKNSLIEKILKMQRINVRRAEKLDFLEEHSRALLAELQKKTKIIQNYILYENFDAMGNSERDRYKAQLARHGGIMASVFNHRVSDNNMTLELSLEINQKLQAVLEDALLKNITLKDNIDTLGEEIARLTMKNQQILKSTK